MLGLMQSQQLLISSLIDFAERHHGDAEVVSRRVEGDIHRSNYKQVAARTRQEANTAHSVFTEPARPDDCGWLANRWCELLPIPLELKQRMMALDNPLVRLELVSDLLARTGIAP